MKFFKRANLITGILFIYTTGLYIYLFPRNHEMSNTKKWITVIASYLLLLVLWFVLKKRDRLRKEREEETKQ